MGEPPAGTRQLVDHPAAFGVDLGDRIAEVVESRHLLAAGIGETAAGHLSRALEQVSGQRSHGQLVAVVVGPAEVMQRRREEQRSEEHTSELQSLMRISYAVFCLKKKKQ